VLTLLELPNLLGALEQLQQTAEAERVVGMATVVEALVARLGRPQALARAARVRAAATEQLGAWGHARYLAGSAEGERLHESGRFRPALEAARVLLSRAEAAGEAAYPEAAYDLATCYFRLGRALKVGGDAGAALAPLAEARQRFQKLANAGNANAAHMASVT